MSLEEHGKDNLPIHSFLNQNFLVESFLQSTAPDSSSLVSLGVGLGVQDGRSPFPAFGSNDVFEFTSSLDGGYNVGIELCVLCVGAP